MAGRAGTGWDVTSGALCIVGIPGPRLLVPVHSAAEPGGGGERGARGREARRRAGQPGARREKARAAERAQARHLAAAAAAAAEPPRKCRAGPLAARPVPAARVRPPRSSGRGSLGASGPGAYRAAHGRARAAGLSAAHAGASRAHGALPGPAPAARESLWFCSKSKPGSQLLLEPRPPACAWALLWAGDSPGPSPGDPSRGGRAGLEAGGGGGELAGRPGPGRPGAVVRGVVLSEAPVRRRVAVPGTISGARAPGGRGVGVWLVSAGRVGWGVGGDLRDCSQAGAGRSLSRDCLERGHGNPRCFRSSSDRPFVCFVVGSFF